MFVGEPHLGKVILYQRRERNETMKVNTETMKKGSPVEMIYFQCAGLALKDNDYIETVAVCKDDILNMENISTNMFTDDNIGYIKMLKERPCEIRVPANAQIFYCENIEDDSENNDLNSEMSVEDFVMKRIIDSTKKEFPTEDCTEVATDGTVFFTIALECYDSENEAASPDEADLRIFQVIIDCEKQIVTFRERIVTPEISGINISDPCFVFMESLSDDEKYIRCNLNCEDCSCNLSNSESLYHEFIYSE